MMKWHRKIKSIFFTKEKENNYKKVRVYVPSCGWGTLESFSESGNGYISYESGGGSIIRNWDHFLNLVETIET